MATIYDGGGVVGAVCFPNTGERNFGVF